MSEESQEDTTDSQKPLRGTASRMSPISAKAPEPPEDEAVVSIRTPDNSVRQYELTDDVKDAYETMVEYRISDYCYWYETWWDGTELVIEYEGEVRDNELRPDHEELTSEEIQHMLHNGERPEMDGIPKRDNQQMNMPSQEDLIRGIMPEPTISVDVNEHYNGGDVNTLDEGILPVINRTRIDVQERADENPLVVEDMFVKPWSDEEGHEPINSEHEDGEIDEEMFEVDFRDTGNEDNTVPEGARGDRWHL